MAVLTTAGKTWIVNKMRGTETGTLSHIGWGTGTTAEAVGQTALVTEVQTRQATTITAPSPTVHRAVATMTADATRNITEVGLFDAATAGDMAVRALFTAIPLEANDQITFTLDITVA